MELLQISLRGHLTRNQLEQAFDSIEADLESSTSPLNLIVDCSSMTGYDMAARSTFIEWNKKWRRSINKVAIVTENTLFHMVIRIMAKVTSQQMKYFTDLGSAVEWAQE